jgi:hypothetical protein
MSKGIDHRRRRARARACLEGRSIAAGLRQSSGASSHARFGAVSFIHRFGASLNCYIHYHCCVIDGVFEPLEDAADVPEAVRFRPAGALTPEAVAAITEQVRIRVLRWFARSGLIDRDNVREMQASREQRLLSGCRGTRRGARSRRPGASAALLCSAPVRARASGSARRRTRRLPVAQASARWHHGAHAHAARGHRSSRGAACSQLGRRPRGTAIATMACSRPTRPCVRLP